MTDEVGVVELVLIPAVFALDITVVVFFPFGLKKLVDPSLRIAMTH